MPRSWQGSDLPDIPTPPDPIAIEWWKTFDDPILTELIYRALQGNYDLATARARICEARALRRVAFSRLWPSVDGNIVTSRSQLSANAVLGVIETEGRPFDVYEVGFDAIWELDLFGRRRWQLQEASAEICVAVNEYRDAMVALFAEVARNYIDVRGFQGRIAITLEDVAAQEELVRLTEARFGAGLVSALDFSDAKTLLGQTLALVPRFEASMRLAMYRLGVLIGCLPESLYELLEAPQPIPSVDAEFALGLPAELVRRRPDVRAAEWELVAHNARIGAAIADMFPNISLEALFGFESLRIGILPAASSRFWNLALSLLQPIFDAGRRRAVVESERAAYTEACLQYQQTVLVAFEEVRSALVEYYKGKERVSILAEASVQGHESVRLATLLYTSGIEDFQRVLDAERAVNRIDEQLVAGEQEVSNSAAAVYKALGGGWEICR